MCVFVHLCAYERTYVVARRCVCVCVCARARACMCVCLKRNSESSTFNDFFFLFSFFLFLLSYLAERFILFCKNVKISSCELQRNLRITVIHNG